jgi:hypothetical protein
MTAARLTAGWVSRTSSGSRGSTFIPTAHDHVLGAVDDVVVAVPVAAADVPGAEPAVADRLGGGFRAVQIALHHVVAADRDLAVLSVGHRAPLVVDELHLDTPDGQAEHRAPSPPARGSPPAARPRRTRRCAGCPRRRRTGGAAPPSRPCRSRSFICTVWPNEWSSGSVTRCTSCSIVPKRRWQPSGPRRPARGTGRARRDRGSRDEGGPGRQPDRDPRRHRPCPPRPRRAGYRARRARPCRRAGRARGLPPHLPGRGRGAGPAAARGPRHGARVHHGPALPGRRPPPPTARRRPRAPSRASA